MGADQSRNRERTMNDSTHDASSRALSNLDLETPEKPYLDSNELIINMGPQHPATHGVLRVILKLDGEKVLGTECVIGYLHRGVEKIGENRTYTMFNPYVDRMDYVAAESDCQPPALAGHARARYRSHDAAVLHVPGSRGDPQDFRKVLRRTSDHAC